MSHLELTYRLLSTEYLRVTYILIELVLSISFNSPRLNAVMRYTKVVSVEKLKLPKQTKFIDQSLHNSSLYFHLGTSNQTARRTSTTLPRGHVLRGEFSALIRKTSPTARFLQGDVYFCLLWSRGRFSLDQRFKNISARYCICLHLRRDKESFFWNVRIQLFQRLRNLTRMVGRGLNIHLIFFCNRALWILLWFHEPMDSPSSLSPPVKLVPLSDLISLTWPLLPINCLDAIKKGSVPKLCAIFMFFARIAKHVKIPTDVKDGRSGVRRLTGKSTIFCSQTGRWRWRPSTH